MRLPPLPRVNETEARLMEPTPNRSQSAADSMTSMFSPLRPWSVAHDTFRWWSKRPLLMTPGAQQINNRAANQDQGGIANLGKRVGARDEYEQESNRRR